MRKLKITELERLTPGEFKLTPKRKIIVVLDNVRSLHNVGSVFRTADSFCLQAVYLCGITDTPPHNEIHKTALGAEESMDWKYFKTTEEALDELRIAGYNVIAIEQVDKSCKLGDFKPLPGESYALVFGNEVKGVQQKVIDLCDLSLEIPQHGTKHSLNIAVSVGITIWELSKYLPIK